MKLSDEQESRALSLVYDCLAIGLVEDDVVWSLSAWVCWHFGRLTHDISLNEYEDDDLSEVTEITDENGITLSQLDLDLK